MLTILEYTSDGVQTVYDVDFVLGYLDTSHVYVFSSTELDDFETELTYTWVNATQIELDTPVTNGDPVKIRRVVPRDTLINDYVDGAIIRELNLDDSFKQALMILQEMKDGFHAPLAETYLRDNLDMLNHRILNLADAVDTTDAISYGQALTLINAITGGVGAVADQILFDTTATSAVNTNIQDAIDELILALRSDDTDEATTRGTADTTLQTNIDNLRAEVIRTLGTVTGTNSLIAAATPALTSYSSNTWLALTPVNNNTGVVTINVNSLGIKSIEKSTGALAADEIVAGVPMIMRYNGTKFILMNPQPTSLVITKQTPTAQGYAGNVTRTFNHTLGAVPDIVTVTLKCTNVGGEYGYSQNEEVDVDPFTWANGAISYGFGIIKTSTQIIMTISEHGITLPRKNDRVVQVITDAYWDIYITTIKLS